MMGFPSESPSHKLFKPPLDLVYVILRDASMIGQVLEQLARSVGTLDVDFKFSTKSCQSKANLWISD